MLLLQASVFIIFKMLRKNIVVEFKQNLGSQNPITDTATRVFQNIFQSYSV